MKVNSSVPVRLVSMLEDIRKDVYSPHEHSEVFYNTMYERLKAFRALLSKQFICSNSCDLKQVAGSIIDGTYVGSIEVFAKYFSLCVVCCELYQVLSEQSYDSRHL